LIDLHRAQVRPSVPRRWRDKDLAGLYFSALDIGLTRRDRLRFLKHYFQRPLRRILAEEAALLTILEGKAARLQERYESKEAKDAPGPSRPGPSTPKTRWDPPERPLPRWIRSWPRRVNSSPATRSAK